MFPENRRNRILNLGNNSQSPELEPLSKLEHPIIETAFTLDHKRIIDELLNGIESNRIFIVGIGGLAGSGKTHMSEELKDILIKKGRKVFIFRYDNYFHDLAQSSEKRDLDYDDRTLINEKMFQDILETAQSIEEEALKNPDFVKPIILFETPILTFHDRGNSFAQHLAQNELIQSNMMLYTVLPNPELIKNSRKYRKLVLDAIKNYPYLTGPEIVDFVNKKSNIKLPKLNIEELKIIFESMANPEEIDHIYQQHKQDVDNWKKRKPVSIMGSNLSTETKSKWTNILIPEFDPDGFFQIALDQIFSLREFINFEEEFDSITELIYSAAFAMTLLKRLGLRIASDPEYSDNPNTWNARVFFSKYYSGEIQYFYNIQEK